MKPELEFDFSLTETDYVIFNKAFFRAAGKRRFIFSLIFLAIAVLYVVLQYYYFALIVALLSLSFPLKALLIKHNAKKTFEKSSYIKRSGNYLFFDDHIEARYFPDSYSMGSRETHYPFDAIKQVMEDESAFYFFVAANEALILPKRICDDDQRRMLANLVMNLFDNRYKAV